MAAPELLRAPLGLEAMGEGRGALAEVRKSYRTWEDRLVTTIASLLTRKQLAELELDLGADLGAEVSACT